MARSRNGEHRRRQIKIEIPCPHCGLTIRVNRPTPSRPLHVTAHFDPEGFVCPPLAPGNTDPVPLPRMRQPEFPGQGALFVDA